MTQDISKEIEQLSQKYMDRSSDELFYLFLQEWGKVQPTGKLPVRGNAKDFWQGVKQKLVVRILKNRDTISATVEFLLGVVTAEVVRWALSVGINLNIALLPIAIFVALITQSVLDQLKADKSK